MAKKNGNDLRKRRHQRLRQKVKGTAARPRLHVSRTLRHIHVQVIDDVNGKTLASSSTMQADVASQIEGGKGSVAAAKVVGAAIAAKAKEVGIEAVVFDRNGVQYHGAVKEFAEAAREAGLQF
ncbi:LSU ribosomal protein L18P [Abditibacterium utsteinense]|uniref:Large ribosomal subunit protein uL18 n=1 Tax=Abditibacterium utsteinense TaxID=1960156 RepID=A0A2S8ST32_9BACT|nr:50S ribosomal protein L18 [Abditibacterium utsteinense]PQV63960.1 LSU ribosomal protein L18P [Abditibacterium utsteinense]